MQQNYLTYYQLLEVSVDATTEEIIKAYKQKTLSYHPDRNHGSDVANRMLQLLNDAKEWLTDSAKRKQYDEIAGIKPRAEPQPRVIYKTAETVRIGSSKEELLGTALFAGAVGVLVGILLSGEE